MKPIDPSAAHADEVDRDNIAGSPCADEPQDVRKPPYFSVLIKVSRPIVIVVLVLIGMGGDQHGQEKPGHTCTRQGDLKWFSWTRQSHAEAFNFLSVAVSQQQAKVPYREIIASNHGRSEKET